MTKQIEIQGSKVVTVAKGDIPERQKPVYDRCHYDHNKFVIAKKNVKESI